ncbi:MAG: hypothetical protein GXP21_07055 [Gammaproteobacteria bacterium]|nr:hypothetical protein [Gammaproteobacteria bacterium]
MGNQKYIFALLLAVVTVLPFESAQARSICADDRAVLRVNEVVIEIESDNNCRNGGGPIRYTTDTTPSNNQEICITPGIQFSGFRIPNGFVVSRVNGTSDSRIDCTTGFGNGISYNITRPSNNGTTFTCPGPGQLPGDNLVPDGFAVIAVDSNSLCGTTGNGARFTIRRPSSSSTTTICSISGAPVPTGFVVTRTDRSSSACATSGQGAQLSVKVPVAGDFICASQGGAPDGFAVIAEDNSRSRCSGGPAFQIGTPRIQVISAIIHIKGTKELLNN